MTQLAQEKLNNYIAVDNASTKKKKIIALEDIPKGFTVLTEKPLISTVEVAHIDKYCSNCFKPLEIKLKCSRCRFSHYCSKECQKENYGFHKFICQAKKNFPYLNITTLIQLTAQLLYEIKKDSSIEQTINKLYCYEKKERMENKQKLYDWMSPILQSLKINTDSTRIAHLMNIIDCNMLYIFQPFSEYFAYGLYINASKFEHDCNPNCMLLYNGNELHIRSIRPIKKGENITFSYISINLPYSERKIRLKNIYNYECQCDRCMEVKIIPN
ncbi:SET domain-containing protein [Anaeromyces robustus]|uniref:SET domain-containing protein n=1 Tax=Anaeromyces robustus TaxID=1754192 RepID=A0A1Y1XJ96_9FUNG|nr:SET domain-containing protein [Anaeromyces robustus]|eukprot:ORX85772.1 SET domain-containing protein [Anaeromyces robustus]